MPYTPQTESDVLSSMISIYTSLMPIADDVNRGSVIRSLLETSARAFKEYYTNQVNYGVELQNIAAYDMFNFNLLQPTAAYTMEQFSVSTAPTADTLVPAGTTVGIDGKTTTYQTAGDFTWPANSTSVNIRIVCTDTGTVGNTPANTITTLIGSINGLSNVTVTNTKDVITGTDLETEDERMKRFADFLSSIHRGDTSALPYGARQTKILDDYGYVIEQVVKAQLSEGQGSNTIYIDNGEYTTSSTLVSQCQQVINGYVDTDGSFIVGYKTAGIPSTVQAATVQQTQVSVTVTLQDGYTLDMVDQTIIDSITKLVKGLNVGDTLYLKGTSSISTSVGSVPGVTTFTINSPSADVVPAVGTIIQLAPGYPTVASA